MNIFNMKFSTVEQFTQLFESANSKMLSYQSISDLIELKV